jgi:NADH-quinone oxidoreductase subunit C
MSVLAALGPVSGTGATEAFGLTTVDVDAAGWARAVEAAAAAGATYLDLLTAYDEGERIAVVALVMRPDASERLLLRTHVPAGAPELATVTHVHRGADWHERETHEMFGVRFVGHPGLRPLLLPPDAPAAPLRKDVLLDARLASAWPGDKDPSDSEGRPRRRVPPPGVPADHVVPPRAGA